MVEEYGDSEIDSQEVEQEIIDYLKTPKSDEGLHPELTESFEKEYADRPLTRGELEKNIEDFTYQNFEKFLPAFLVSEGIPYSFSERERLVPRLIREFNISDKELKLLNPNWYLERREDGDLKICCLSEEGEETGTPVSYLNNLPRFLRNILALLYARENLRVDSINEGSFPKSRIFKRYYFRPLGRYLCANDFGMSLWNQEKGRRERAEVFDIKPFMETIIEVMERIATNIQLIAPEILSIVPDSSGEVRGEGALLEYGSCNMSLEELTRRFSTWFGRNPREKEMVIRALPITKLNNQIRFRYDRLAKKLGFITNNPIGDFEKFEKNSWRLNRLIRGPVIGESNLSLNFAHSEIYKRPVVTNRYFDITSILAEAYSKIKDLLLERVISEYDGEIEEILEQFQSRRSEYSPYFYYKYEVYDFMKAVGIEKTKQVLASDDREIARQLEGFRILKAMRYNLSQFEPNELKRQLYYAYLLGEAELWKYLRKKVESEIRPISKDRVWEGHLKHWLELLDWKTARDLFRKGKQMYWLAKQVWLHAVRSSESDKFYYFYSRINWSQYDLGDFSISKDQLEDYLKRKSSLIGGLLFQERGSYYEYEGDEERENKEEEAIPLSLILQVLESGKEFRGVVLALNQRRYLESLLENEINNDLEFAIKDWPPLWRQAVPLEEIKLYYMYGENYLLNDPKGFIRYVQWRASAGEEFQELLKKPADTEAELDFRICFSAQSEDVKNWWREAAEYIGYEFMKRYFLRFNALRDSHGQIVSWHDSLLWVRKIRELETDELISILSNIETAEENYNFISLLSQYDREQDPLRTSGPIQSLEELKRRVMAIKENIDLSRIPSHVLEITSAPHFDLASLRRMSERSDFHALINGEFDKKQPFAPLKRTFCARPLNEVLKEALGSRKENIRGTARDPKGLFAALRNLISDQEIEGRKMEVADLFNYVPPFLEEEIIKLLLDEGVDVGPIVEAQIHAKSDPEGWVCGNYTDCCMPFGSSINNEYMFHPSTQYFTVKYKGRIIAQSVVIDALDSRTGEDVIILDNIEVARNYTHLSPLLSQVYQVFWSEYTSKPVKIGVGHSDLIPTVAVLERNIYQPKESLTYSDAAHENIYDLPKIAGIEPFDKTITFMNLSERDAGLIAKIEAEVYPENMRQGEAYITEILREQRELEMPGAASSFLVRRGKKVAGYLLVLLEDSEINRNEQVAHIYDMAVLPEFRAGGEVAFKMMKRVVETCSLYGYSIEAEVRASTTYLLLMNRRVQEWLKNRGFTITSIEPRPQYIGGEDFYFIRLENTEKARI